MGTHPIFESDFDCLTGQTTKMTIELDLEINDLSLEGTQNLFRIIRPKWEFSKIQRKVFTEGITNSLSAYFINSLADEDAVVVRHNGPSTEQFLNRQKEITSYTRLSDAKVCKPLVATFKNGLVMQVIKGSVLNQKNVSNKVVASSTARAIATMHREVKLAFDETSEVFSRQTGDFLRLTPDRYTKNVTQARAETIGIPSKKELFVELQEAKKLMNRQSTPLVLCHNDILLNNILYEENTNNVHIIDYEYLGANPAAYDIANHFAEYAGTDEVNFDNIPGDDYQKWWLTEYLKEFLNSDSIDQKTVDSWHGSVQLMLPLSHLMWGCWALLQAELSQIDFDYLEYALLRLDQYFITKRKFL